MRESYDVIVIGAGAMGASAAWHLARNGIDVAVFEQFERGHHNGSSHGSTRIFRHGYSEQQYVRLADEAHEWWRQLELESDTDLLEQSGCLDHGPPHIIEPITALLKEAGIPVEELPTEDAAERWPGLRYDENVIYQPAAGRIHADRTVDALLNRAAAHGAPIKFQTPVRALNLIDDRTIDVITDHGTTRARHVIAASGAWTHELVRHIIPLPQVLTTQEQPAHFRPVDTSISWPAFLHHGDPATPGLHMYGAYGLHAPGEGMKIGLHGTGIVCDPDARTFQPDPRSTQILQNYVRRWVPGVDPSSAEPISCLYTTTDNEDFIIDRHGPLTIATGFSGHGFKFTPVIGRILTDLATHTIEPPELFSIQHRSPSRRRRRADITTLLRHLDEGVGRG